MNELQIFNNPEFGAIRSIQIDGDPWFVGKDVAAALGYADTDKAIREHVDDEDKNLIKPAEIAGLKGDSESAGLNIPNRGMYLINESGVYALIFGSKLDSAKRFKHWVTKEVLPSIRKTGAYGVPKTTFGLPAPRVATAKRILAQRNEILEEIIPDRPETQLNAMKKIKNLLKENGFNCPSIVVDPKSATLQDIFDAQDFGLAHPGATWEDYLAYLLIPRLTS